MAKYTAQDRRDLAKKGHALPDGSFPIHDVEDLHSAIRNVGRGSNPYAAKRHIIKRARQMGVVSELPEKWRENLEHQDAQLDDFLQHFGVKGMKWGVHHDDESTSARDAIRQEKRETKAAKYDKLADMYNTKISDLNNQNFRFSYQQRNAQNQVRELSAYRDQALKDAAAKRQGKLSKGQKQLIIGASVAAAIVATAVVASKLESGEARQTVTKGKAFLTGKSATAFKEKAEFADKSLNADQVFDKVVHGINPNYGSPGTVNNCRRATFAYELRRRGFDVAATRTTEGNGQNAAGLYNAINPGKRLSTSPGSVASRIIKEQTTNARHRAQPLTDIGAAFAPGARSAIVADNKIALKPETIFETLAKQPSGSRGELGVQWIGGGAHSLAYEVFDGKPAIFDTQSGVKYTTIEAVKDGLGHVKEAGFTRLDNLDLNNDFLLRWVKNVK